MAAFSCAGIFLGCVAVATPYNKATACVLVALGLFATGWNECIAIATIVSRRSTDYLLFLLINVIRPSQLKTKMT
jgi:hypothetical protein